MRYEHEDINQYGNRLTKMPDKELLAEIKQHQRLDRRFKTPLLVALEVVMQSKISKQKVEFVR